MTLTIRERKVRGERVHSTLDTKRARQEEMHEFQVQSETIHYAPQLRKLVVTPHIEKMVERIFIWTKAGLPVHIVGPTGCGKTTLALYVASQLGRPIVWLNGDEQLTTFDLVGGYDDLILERLRDRFVRSVYKSRDVFRRGWVDNPLTNACKYGYTLIYNEFARAKPEANNVLLSVFEEGVLEIPEKLGTNRYFPVHPEFKALLTSNSIEYAGMHKPQDALLDRMINIQIDYFDFETELEIVRSHSGISGELAERVVKFVRTLRGNLPPERKPSTRAAIMIAKGLAVVGGPSSVVSEEKFVDLCHDVIGSQHAPEPAASEIA